MLLFYMSCPLHLLCFRDAGVLSEITLDYVSVVWFSVKMQNRGNDKGSSAILQHLSVKGANKTAFKFKLCYQLLYITNLKYMAVRTQERRADLVRVIDS